MKHFLLFILSALCVACSVARQAAPSEKLSTRVEVVTVFEKDTVLVEIPQIVEKVQTMDTVSFLENEFAKSSAEKSCKSSICSPTYQPSTAQLCHLGTHTLIPP